MNSTKNGTLGAQGRCSRRAGLCAELGRISRARGGGFAADPQTDITDSWLTPTASSDSRRSMLRPCFVLLALLAACRPVREHRGVSTPTSSSAVADVGADVHSYAHPEQVATVGIELALAVSFDDHAIDGVATFALRRDDRRAPLVLDTRDLAIARVEIAGAGTTPSWQPAKWSLSARDRHLGSA